MPEQTNKTPNGYRGSDRKFGRNKQNRTEVSKSLSCIKKIYVKHFDFTVLETLIWGWGGWQGQEGLEWRTQQSDLIYF